MQRHEGLARQLPSGPNIVLHDPDRVKTRPKPRNTTTPCWSIQTWRRDSIKMASDKPGAVHIALSTVARMLGHSDPTMTLRYAHVSDREVEAAADRIGKVIQRAMATGK